MKPKFLKMLERVWKAMWVGDIRRAYDILDALPADEEIDPVLRRDILFNLAIFSRILDNGRADYHHATMEKLYKDVSEYYPKTRAIVRKKWKPHELEERICEKPGTMSFATLRFSGYQA